MSTLDSLLAEFQAAFEAGEQPNVGEMLERASPDERQALHQKIDSYLMNTPRRPWNQAEYESSPAKQSVERVWDSLEGVSGSWPVLLPHLRHKAKLKRAELVSRLSEALGVADREAKVAGYYNEMEHGQLRVEGVSERVFAALAEILETTAEKIRGAGGAITPESGGPEAAFTRTIPDFDQGPVPGVSGLTPPTAHPALRFDSDEDALADASERPPLDEVDELFLGG